MSSLHTMRLIASRCGCSTSIRKLATSGMNHRQCPEVRAHWATALASRLHCLLGSQRFLQGPLTREQSSPQHVCFQVEVRILVPSTRLRKGIQRSARVSKAAQTYLGGGLV